jgi:CheY-like chemotaxis protein
LAKVLVIDDDSALRSVITEVLTAAGHEVIEAKDGREGLDLFRLHQPTLVVTDILMPEKDGLETIQELRNGGSNVAIIAVSSSGPMSSSQLLDLARLLGADAGLQKPVSAPELMDLVNGLLAP